MRFSTIPLTAAQADSADPRSAPASVPDDHLLDVPLTVPGTDERPRQFAVTLEGTAGQQVTVQFFTLDEGQNFSPNQMADDIKDGKADRKWYALGATAVITVGTVTFVAAPCVPGRVYCRHTSAPAAASILKVAFV